MTERHSPLHRLHADAGAAFTDFAGWQMPLRFGSELAEHHAVRTAAGVFDISHMGEITIAGPDTAAFLDFALSGTISAVEPMQAKYSLLLNERGGVIDDVIVYRTNPGEYLLVANAGNRGPVFAELSRRSRGFDVEIADISDRTALIAVQGPASLAVLQQTTGLRIMDDQQRLDELKHYRATGARFADGTVLVARTGYTGEDGFELYVDAPDAAPLWRALLEAGAPHGLIPAGLAARDTLRLEAGMPLYGHELGPDILPAQAGLGRVVSLAKGSDFVGRAAVESGPGEGARVLVGLSSEGRRAGRAGYAVLDGAGQEAGTVTSGALSPTLGHPIAMAFVDPGAAEAGTELAIDVRGSRIPATVVPLPFYKRTTPERKAQS